MTDTIRLLILEDRASDAELMLAELRRTGFEPDWTRVDSEANFLAALDPTLDLILADYHLPQFDGVRALKLMQERGLDIPFILVSGTVGEDIAVGAMRNGASDYMLKDRMARLGQAVSHALEQKRLRNENQRVQESLRESEDRYRDLVENSNDLICTHDLAGKLLSVNESAMRLTGYSREALLQMNMIDLIKPDMRRLFSTYLKKVQTSGHARGLMHIQTASGETRIWEYDNTLRVGGLPVPIVRGMAHDVTERKQSEAALRDSRMQLEGIFNTAMDAIITIDDDQRIVIFNPAAEQMFRCPASEAIGGTLDRFISEYYRDRHKESVRAFGQSSLTRRSMSTSTSTFTSLRADGEAFPSEVSISQLEIGGRKLYTAIIRDITERKRAEDALRIAETNYRSILQNAPVGFFQTTPEGRFLTVNPMMARINGYASPEEMKDSVTDIGRQVYADLADRIEFLRQMNEYGEVREFVNQNRRKDGRIIWVSTNARMVKDAEGKTLYFEGFLTDISARMQAEEKLAASEAELRALFAAMQDVVLTIDKDGIYRKIAPTNPVLLVRPPEELLGKSLAEVFPQAEADQFLSATRQVLATGQSKQIEYQLRVGETPHWFLANITPMTEELTVWVARDITEHKHAQDEIRNLKEFDENLINSMSEGIVVQNTDGNFTFVNPAVSAITGYLPDELLGGHWTKFLPADQHKIIKEADNRRLAGEASQYEIDFLHKNGKRINLLVSGSPLFENERFSGTMAVFTDITERKHAEEKIRQQLERLTALREIDQVITSTLDAGSSLDLLTAHTVNLLAVDAVTVLLLNSATNTLEYGAGLGFWTDAPKTASVKLDESYAGRAATERRIVNIPNLADEPGNLFLTGFLKDENFVSYYGAPLIAKGKVIGVLEVFNRSVVERDGEWLDFFNTLAGQAAIAIDNARLFEDLQRTNIELEMRVEERTVDLIKANRAKDEFLANMSHELRTPLNAVLNMSESLQEGTYGELKPRQADTLRIIEESGRHLLELINDILDLSKIEAGKLKLQAESVEVEAYCQASMRMIKETAFLKHLEVSFSIPGDIEFIHADGRRLKQMLVNLLSNAVKFTPAGGQVGLDVSREGGHAIRFSVWDTGIGIPADQLEKLFKPFVQLDSSLSRQYMGTGLGLALVHNLAELHGGSVGVESELGKGSRFYFIIPIRSLNPPITENGKELAPDKPNEIKINNKKNQRVLLVDDNVINMLVTSDYLSDKGYQVIGASDGQEAIAFVKEQRPDIILMDIQMPGISGIEAIKHLRSIGEFETLPIIALTALAMPGDRERCLQAGANEYLSKPVSLKGLIQLIEKLLKNET